jgi:hypothetical protein
MNTLAAECIKEDSLTYFFRLYDVATGTERLVQEPKEYSLDHILFSPDGTMLATHWSGEGPPDVVYLSEVSSGKAVHRLTLPRNIRARALAFSPDGRTLAMLYSIRAEPQTLVLWETVTGRERARINGGAFSFEAALAFSPDGKSIAAGCSDDAIRLWSARTGKLLGQRAGHEGGASCLTFSHDGRTLFSGGRDTSALAWNLDSVLHQQPAPQLIDLDERELESLWSDLADEDARRAFLAIRLLGSARQFPEWARQRIKPVALLEPKRLAQLVADLHDNTFAVHDGARVELEKLRELARPALEQALRNKLPGEQAHRIQRLLDRVTRGHEWPGEVIQTTRAIEALEMLGMPEAKRLLGELAAGNPDANLTRECKAAEKRLTASGK